MGSGRMARRTAMQLGMAGGIMAAACSHADADDVKPDAFAVSPTAARPRDWRAQLRRMLAATPFVDTHEHLIEEDRRIKADHPLLPANDWSVVLTHYLESDLAVAGMPDDARARFYGSTVEPVDKWKLLEPYWPLVKHTGYGQACAIALRRLYGVENLDKSSVKHAQAGYEKLVKPGFYKKVLVDTANIDSCQVNSLTAPFMESRMPDLLLQDISILGMHMHPDIAGYAQPAGIDVKDLASWHGVIDWWFEKYGKYAVAVKTQAGYMRDVDFEDLAAEDAEPLFRNFLNDTPMPREDHLRLQGHLFWYCVRRAAEYELPVKMHLGYHAGHNRMPYDTVSKNVGSVSNILSHAVQHVPAAHFVLMHIAYPDYERLVAVAKQYVNCTVDMCWAWIINPSSSAAFLKHFLMAAPLNKVLTFGGDYIAVEPVVGHAAIARQGLFQALSELVEEDWLTPRQALAMVEPLMRRNAEALFRLYAKKKACRNAPWAV